MRAFLASLLRRVAEWLAPGPVATPPHREVNLPYRSEPIPELQPVPREVGTLSHAGAEYWACMDRYAFFPEPTRMHGQTWSGYL